MYDISQTRFFCHQSLGSRTKAVPYQIHLLTLPPREFELLIKSLRFPTSYIAISFYTMENNAHASVGSLESVSPPHPLSCLRVIRLPRCFVCGMPSAIYCGGCISAYAYCSPAHFLMVCVQALCLSILFTNNSSLALARALKYLSSKHCNLQRPNIRPYNSSVPQHGSTNSPNSGGIRVHHCTPPRTHVTCTIVSSHRPYFYNQFCGCCSYAMQRR